VRTTQTTCYLLGLHLLTTQQNLHHALQVSEGVLHASEPLCVLTQLLAEAPVLLQQHLYQVRLQIGCGHVTIRTRLGGLGCRALALVAGPGEGGLGIDLLDL
jgi:hypothetical protein